MKAIVYASSGSTVNLRTAPSKVSSIMLAVPVNSAVEVKKADEDWSLVSYGEKTGYMMTKFLKYTGDFNGDTVLVPRAKLEQIYKEIQEILNN